MQLKVEGNKERRTPIRRANGESMIPSESASSSAIHWLGRFGDRPSLKRLSKKWQEIPGADHDNVLITSFPIYADIAEWMIPHVLKPPA